MRRDELAGLGVHLPVLPTVVLGGLPGGPCWAERLERLGLDVVASGAAGDTPDTFRAARAAVPHRPVKAAAGDTALLAAAGAVIVEGAVPRDGVYALGADDAACLVVTAADDVEDVDLVAARVLAAVTAGLAPSEVWVAAGPGLDALAEDVVAAKLAALTEGTRRARLHLAKTQFEL